MEPAVGSVVRTSKFLVLTTLGRLLRLAGFARLKIEARDRPPARTGPHSRLQSLSPGGGIFQYAKKGVPNNEDSKITIQLIQFEPGQSGLKPAGSLSRQKNFFSQQQLLVSKHYRHRLQSKAKSV